MKALKISAVLTAAVMSAAMLCPAFAADANAAQKNTEDKPVYAALGDSIAYGYGLDDRADSYAALTAKAINANEYYDLTQCGADAADVIEIVSDNSDKIAQADVITLSVGANSLFIPFLRTAAEYAGVDFPDTEISADKFADSITPEVVLMLYLAYSNKKSPETAALNKEFQTFTADWNTLIDDIREINPDAELVVTGYFNPYRHWNFKRLGINMGDIVQTYIDKMNRFIDVSCAKRYLIADISDVGKDNFPDIIHFENNKFDPHPDADGHRIIADAVVSVLKTRRSL